MAVQRPRLFARPPIYSILLIFIVLVSRIPTQIVAADPLENATVVTAESQPRPLPPSPDKRAKCQSTTFRKQASAPLGAPRISLSQSRRLAAYPAYCNKQPSPSTRQSPTLPPAAIALKPELVQVHAFIRHGARVPYDKHSCWKGYSPTWTCEYSEVIRGSLMTPAVNSDRAVPLGAKSASIVERRLRQLRRKLDDEGFADRLQGAGDSLGDISSSKRRVLFDSRMLVGGLVKVYDADPERNELRGNCLTGQIIEEGIRQHQANGEYLAQNYFHRSHIRKLPHPESPVLFNVDTFNATTDLYVRSTDYGRTILSAGALLSSMFETARSARAVAGSSQTLSTPSPPDLGASHKDVFVVHTATLRSDYWIENPWFCPKLQKLEQSIVDEHVTPAIRQSYAKLIREIEILFGQEVDWQSFPDTLLDCLMVSVCNPDHWEDLPGPLQPSSIGVPIPEASVVSPSLPSSYRTSNMIAEPSVQIEGMIDRPNTPSSPVESASAPKRLPSSSVVELLSAADRRILQSSIGEGIDASSVSEVEGLLNNSSNSEGGHAVVAECVSPSKKNETNRDAESEENLLWTLDKFIAETLNMVDEASKLKRTYNASIYSKMSMARAWEDIRGKLRKVLDSSEEFPAEKFILWSGHDTTLMPLLASLGPEVWDGHWIPYASLGLIEVYRIDEGAAGNSTASSSSPSNLVFRFIINGEDRTAFIPFCSDDPLVATTSLCPLEHLMAATAWTSSYLNDCFPPTL